MANNWWGGNAQQAQSGTGMLGTLSGTTGMQGINQQHQYFQQLAQQMQVPQTPPIRPDKYVHSALQGLMGREASYLFTYDEMAKEAWDLADAMAKEAQKRGY
jgi:hypothetical protein